MAFDTANGDAANGLGAPGGEDARLKREFGRARRHTRTVRLLKVGLPILATVIVAAGIVVTLLARSLPENVTVAGAGFEDGRIVMDAPRIDGFDKADRPYFMVAERAFQSLIGDGIDLEGVSARFAVSESLEVEVAAEGGRYESRSETLTLTGDIRVETSDGMEISLQSALIRPAAGTLEGKGPVLIKTATQTVEAGAISVADSGERLRFSGGMKMILEPRSIQTAATDADAAAVSN